jgi:cytochrome P450
MIAAARFDASLEAWVLTSYADVVAALHAPRLSGGGGDPTAHTAHVAVRDAARRALSSDHVAGWRDNLESSARQIVRALPAGEPLDLVRTFAEPWSQSIALAVSEVQADDAPRLTNLAQEVFLAAARATSTDMPAHALAASAELARTLARNDAPDAASAAVQSFVALTQTMPCALAAAWLELFQRADDAALLRARPALIPRAVEELLRLTGPSRAVFRHATSDLEIGETRVGRGDRVVLMLSAANRDSAKYADPERFDIDRDTSGHLAFGRGAHACSGAGLIREAIAIGTRALLDATSFVELTGRVEWLDGFAIRGPTALGACLRRSN